MELIVLRLIERILVVVVGGLSLYFGFRLLREKPGKQRGRGHITLPNGISIDLKRVGSGVFFALFGAIVVSFSIYKGVTYSETTIGLPGDGAQTIIDFTGVGGKVLLDDDAQSIRVAQDMQFLNETLSSMLSDDLSPTDQAIAELDIQHLKLTLMRGIWDDKWGDFTDFETLVQSNNLATAPSSMREAVTHFRAAND